jgi:hypothetical protein
VDLGIPTINGKYDRGASSPAIPALHIPDPLSMTIAALYELLIINYLKLIKYFLNAIF